MAVLIWTKGLRRSPRACTVNDMGEWRHYFKNCLWILHASWILRLAARETGCYWASDFHHRQQRVDSFRGCFFPDLRHRTSSLRNHLSSTPVVSTPSHTNLRSRTSHPSGGLNGSGRQSMALELRTHQMRDSSTGCPITLLRTTPGKLQRGCWVL